MFVSRASRTLTFISSSSRSTRPSWLHVVPRADHNSASVWVGSLDGTYPHQFRVSVFDVDQANPIELDQNALDNNWVRPFEEQVMKDPSLVDQDVVNFAHEETKDGECSLAANFYEKQAYVNSIELSNLKPDSRYIVRVSATDANDSSKATSVKASFKTLPDTLGDSNKPFTVFMGSCYYHYLDDLRVADAYDKLFANPSYPKPDLNLFMGDQVYLDIPFQEHMGLQTAEEMREHMLLSYKENWEGLHRLFKQANNMFTSDDHEFYNNYPFHPLHIMRYDNPIEWWYREDAPVTDAWPITEKRWSALAKTLYRSIQAPMARDQVQFDIGNDLSFMKVDIRVNRDKDERRLMPAEHFEKLKSWIRNLKSPGVLVLGQPLLINEEDMSDYTDKILSNYDHQYNELMQTLTLSQHDIVLLSGDVHFGRIAHVRLDSGATLHEVISSPMSLIERVPDHGRWWRNLQFDPNKSPALSTFKEPNGPATFPNDIEGVRSHEVVYERFVRSKANNSEEPNSERTEEHFKTVSFSKHPGSSRVDMEVRAWLPRLKIDKSHAADNEITEETWSEREVTSRVGDVGAYRVSLK